MTPPATTALRRDVYWTLFAVERDLGFCLLSFPIATFAGALLIGLCGSLPAMHPAGAPFWIVQSVCVLFSIWAVVSIRSARRGLATIGMPPLEIRRRIARLWISAAVFMMAEGICTLGYLAITFDAAERRSITIFGPFDRPLPLVITLILYTMAGVLLLGVSWRKAREAKKALELQPGGSQEAGKTAEWSRDVELYSGLSSGGGVLVFVIGLFFLGLLTALGNGGHPRLEPSRLLLLGLFAVGSWLGALLVHRSRRHLEAAGFSREEVQSEIASFWRVGAVVMILIGAFALTLIFLGADLLDPSELRWVLGTTLVYIAIGLSLLWWNRRKREA